MFLIWYKEKLKNSYHFIVRHRASSVFHITSSHAYTAAAQKQAADETTRRVFLNFILHL